MPLSAPKALTRCPGGEAGGGDWASEELLVCESRWWNLARACER